MISVSTRFPRPPFERSTHVPRYYMTPHDTYPSFVGQFTGVYELEGHERGAFATLLKLDGHRRIDR